jgi:hypothetical protein
MKRQRDRTREKMLERIRQLRLARDAFRYALEVLPSGSVEETAQRNFNRGFDWVIERIREIA